MEHAGSIHCFGFCFVLLFFFYFKFHLLPMPGLVSYKLFWMVKKCVIPQLSSLIYIYIFFFGSKPLDAYWTKFVSKISHQEFILLFLAYCRVIILWGVLFSRWLVLGSSLLSRELQVIFGSSKPGRRHNYPSDCRLSAVRKPLWSHD